MLLGGELLQQVLVGDVQGLLALGQSVAQPVLMGEEQPDLPAPALGNTCTPTIVLAHYGTHRYKRNTSTKRTALTLAESAVQLLLVLRERRSARGCQLSVPQGQRFCGALAHFLVVQLHLADVQLIPARCNTITRDKREKMRDEGT